MFNFKPKCLLDLIKFINRNNYEICVGCGAIKQIEYLNFSPELKGQMLRDKNKFFEHIIEKEFMITKTKDGKLVIIMIGFCESEYQAFHCLGDFDIDFIYDYFYGKDKFMSIEKCFALAPLMQANQFIFLMEDFFDEYPSCYHPDDLKFKLISEDIDYLADHELRNLIASYSTKNDLIDKLIKVSIEFSHISIAYQKAICKEIYKTMDGLIFFNEIDHTDFEDCEERIIGLDMKSSMEDTFFLDECDIEECKKMIEDYKDN